MWGFNRSYGALCFPGFRSPEPPGQLCLRAHRVRRPKTKTIKKKYCVRKVWEPPAHLHVLAVVYRAVGDSLQRSIITSSGMPVPVAQEGSAIELIRRGVLGMCQLQNSSALASVTTTQYSRTSLEAWSVGLWWTTCTLKS